MNTNEVVTTEQKAVKKRISAIGDLTDLIRDMPKADVPVTHHFSPGVYAREAFMPKGTIVIGKVHKTRHLNIMSKGKCLVVTPTRRLELVAPAIFESLEGEQKVGLMQEDTIWTSIHITEETDLAKIEEACIANDYDDDLINKLINSFGEQPCLG